MAVGIRERVRQTAYLGAASAVGTASGSYQACLAVAAVADAQSPVDKCLEGHCCGLAYLGYLLKGKFSGKHELREPCVLQEAGFLGGAYVALSACMQGYGRYVEVQYAEILHDQGVNTGCVQLSDQPFDL